MKYELGFIGCGNMGGTLARAVARSVDPAKICVFDPDDAKAAACAALGMARAKDAAELAGACRFVVLGVKPQVIAQVIASFRAAIRPQETTVISMAAGISLAALREMFACEVPLIRIMPNTPAAIGEGMILYATDGTDTATENAFLSAFAAAGRIDRIDEGKIDAASALSGCGPAYAYLFIEALADGAVECGVPRDKALLYAAKTVAGAAGMVLAGGHPGELKDAVCSPGGTTIAGVHALEDSAFRAAAMDAVCAAYQRTLELKK